MLMCEKSGISVRLTASSAHHAARHVRRISDLRWALGLALLAVGTTPCWSADKDSWNIRIVPATKTLAFGSQGQPATAPAPYEPGANPSHPTPPMPPGPSAQQQINPGHPGANMARVPYEDIYRSIPFSRAEYVANPSYRNQTTLGLLLGQMPYPNANQTPVPQYGYVAPYQWDNTYSIPTTSSLFYPMPVVW